MQKAKLMILGSISLIVMLFGCVVVQLDKVVYTIEAGQMQQDKWEERTDMPTTRRDLATAAVNGIIYAIGGRGEGGKELSVVEAYDPINDNWAKKSAMPTARGALCACVIDGFIYAIGGEEKGIRAGNIQGIGIATVEMYNPYTNTWAKKSDMPFGRGWISASVVKGKIYALGGAGGDELVSMDVIQEYDPKADKWTTKARMQLSRYGLTTSVVNDKIYVFGGSEMGGFVAPKPLSSVGVYNPLTDEWTENIAQMPTPRWSLSSNAVDGRIYVIGGFNDNGKGTNVMEVYDPSTNTWDQKANMDTARGMLSTTTTDGRIYAIGGGPSAEGNWVGANVWEPFPKGIIEEYDTGSRPQSMNPQGKLSSSWGYLKSIR